MMHKRYYEPAGLATGRAQLAGRSLKPLLLLVFGAWFGAACGGPTFSQGIYDNGVVRYRVGQLGPGWERVEVQEGDALAFFHQELGANVSVNATCQEYEDVPEAALFNHLLFGMRERVFRLEETLSLDGRGALHAIVDVELDGVPVTLEVYMLKKDGCVYDMTLIASRQAFERARPGLARLVSGFHVLSTTLDG
jgi:hypothetical protein